MSAFFAYTIIGIVTGAGYAIAASGFVLTYTTSRVFNMAHGAMAMFAAFLYYALAYQNGMNRLLAIVIVVGLIAPLFGVAMERIVMRGLADAPVNISLVVTVGLFLVLYGMATKIWPPTEIGGITPLLPDLSLTIAGQTITGNDLLIVIIAGAVAVGFYLFFKLTRTGVAMKAVVDNRGLVALHGANPGYLSALSWAIGSSLAALAGVLLVASIGLDYLQLTLLVITAYAAAILGKLENLPLTFVGSMILGLANSYAIGYLPSDTIYNGLRIGLPAIFLFLVLIALPRSPLRVGQIRGIRSVPVPSMQRTLVTGVAVVVAAWAVSGLLDGPSWNAYNMGLVFVFGMIMLSLVLLTGYGGYLNLAPIAFAGIGALTVVKLDSSSPYVLVVAAAITAVVGAVIGLFAIRLGTLYLAIATLAFAQLMDYVVFQSNFGFSFGSQEIVPRMNLLGLHLTSDKDYFVLCAGLFVALGTLVLWLRRGPYGRLLIALRDSPAACGTLGLNLTATRILVFALSSAIAGFAGGIYAQQRVSIGAIDFNVIQNLPLVLALVVCGMTSVTGAAMGGFLLVAMRIIDSLAPYAFIIIGVAAIMLGRQPNGLVSYVFQFGRWALGLNRRGQGAPRPSEGARAEELPEPLGVREEVTVGGTA